MSYVKPLPAYKLKYIKGVEEEEQHYPFLGFYFPTFKSVDLQKKYHTIISTIPNTENEK